ncbi:hypothetical protein ES703_121065 [subsurface metagenome]
MRKSLYLLVVVVVLAGLCSSSALALTPIGPPVATLDRGQFAAGFGYAHSKGDWEGHVLGFSITAEDLELDTYMANLCFGLDEAVELQIDLGASRFDDGDIMNSGDFAGGFGVKATLAKSDKINWGAVFSMHWYEASDSGVYLGMPWSEKDDWMEIQIALGPSYKDGPCRLYGGPFLHLIDGDSECTIDGIPFSIDIKEDSNFGGFVGAQFDLNDKTTLGIEYLFTGSDYGMGASIRFAF